MAILQLAVPPPPEPIHDQVDEPPHDPALYPDGDPAIHELADHPHNPLIAGGGGGGTITLAMLILGLYTETT